MSSLAMMERGTVKLAASPMMTYSLIGPAIADFREQHPNVQFELYELSTRETVEWVFDGKGGLRNRLAGPRVSPAG